MHIGYVIYLTEERQDFSHFQSAYKAKCIRIQGSNADTPYPVPTTTHQGPQKKKVFLLSFLKKHDPTSLLCKAFTLRQMRATDDDQQPTTAATISTAKFSSEIQQQYPAATSTNINHTCSNSLTQMMTASNVRIKGNARRPQLQLPQQQAVGIGSFFFNLIRTY